MRPCSPYWENIERFMAVTLVLLIILGSPIAAAADDGEGDWKEFVLDASADSWKIKGETAVDLRSGRHVTSAFCRIHSGDFIKWSGWNPSWVTLITMDRGKILFSNDGAGDSKVDETAERVPNCVPIHHGNSYVASFDGRTYTIKLVEGHYEFGASYARFLYRPGGTPGPEHEPRKRSAGTAPRPIESDSINFLGASEPANRLDSSEEDRIDTVTVIVKTPPPEDGESPKSYTLSLSLNASYEGGFTSMNRDFLAVREGSAKTFTFEDVRPNMYSVKITYHGQTITDKVDINETTTELEFAFPGAEGYEPRQIEREDAEKTESRGRGWGGRRPVDRRGAQEPVEGWVRVIFVYVTTPLAEDTSVELADLSAEFRGPKHFKLTHDDVRPGAKSTFIFRTFRVGTYDLIVKWGDESITKKVELTDDPTEIELAFR